MTTLSESEYKLHILKNYTVIGQEFGMNYYDFFAQPKEKALLVATLKRKWSGKCFIIRNAALFYLHY